MYFLIYNQKLGDEDSRFYEELIFDESLSCEELSSSTEEKPIVQRGIDSIYFRSISEMIQNYKLFDEITSLYAIIFYEFQSSEELSSLIEVNAIIPRGDDFIYSRSRRCIICRKYCENDYKLGRHIRTHGPGRRYRHLAFLKSSDNSILWTCNPLQK